MLDTFGSSSVFNRTYQDSGAIFFFFFFLFGSEEVEFY